MSETCFNPMKWLLRLLTYLLGGSDKAVRQMCKKLYADAKRLRPDKSERDYLKVVLLTKPPFDYQRDDVVNVMLDSCEDIDALAEWIVYEQKAEFLWKARAYNLASGRQYEDVKERNQAFFREFWGSDHSRD